MLSFSLISCLDHMQIFDVVAYVNPNHLLPVPVVPASACAGNCSKIVLLDPKGIWAFNVTYGSPTGGGYVALQYQLYPVGDAGGKVAKAILYRLAVYTPEECAFSAALPLAEASELNHHSPELQLVQQRLLRQVHCKGLSQPRLPHHFHNTTIP